MAEKNDHVLCSICLNDFDHPKIIDCNHRFCSSCLEDYIKQFLGQERFMCPLCRQDIKIPRGGIQEFPSDLTSYDSDKLANVDSATRVTKYKCDFCNKGIIPKYKCENCDKYLCESCKIIHDKVTGSNKHILNTYEEIENDENTLHKSQFCESHLSNVEFYCEDCSVTACAVCFISHHNGHGFRNLHSKATQKKGCKELNVLTRKLDQSISDGQNYMETLSEITVDFKNSAKWAHSSVDERVNGICSRLKSLGEELKTEITTEIESDNDKLKDALKCAVDILKKKRDISRQSGLILKSKSMVAMMHLIPEIRQQIRDNDSNEEFVFPIIKFPLFQEAVVEDRDLVQLLGSTQYHSDPSFISTFQLQDLIYEKENALNGPNCCIRGLSWYISLVRDIQESALGVFLGINEILEADTQISSCFAEYTIRLVGINDVEFEMDYEFTPGGANWGNGSFIEWSELCDPENGFLDSNNAFTIHTIIKVTRIEK